MSCAQRCSTLATKQITCLHATHTIQHTTLISMRRWRSTSTTANETDPDPHYGVFGSRHERAKGMQPGRMDPAKEMKWRELNASSRPANAEEQETSVLRKRLRYAATKRGWVETQVPPLTTDDSKSLNLPLTRCLSVAIRRC